MRSLPVEKVIHVLFASSAESVGAFGSGVPHRVKQCDFDALRRSQAMVFLAVSFALPLNPSSTPDEITAFSSEPAEDQMPVSPCGDKISSCRRHVQVENSHPQVKNLHPQFKHLHPQVKNPHPQKAEGHSPVRTGTVIHGLRETQAAARSMVGGDTISTAASPTEERITSSIVSNTSSRMARCS